MSAHDDEVFFPFMNQSDEFARGFEVGEFWARAEHAEPTIESEFDAGLEGELLRVAELFEYRRVEWRAVDGGRMVGCFTLDTPTEPV